MSGKAIVVVVGGAASAIVGVFAAGGGDLGLVAVADGEQHRLGVDGLAAALEVPLVDVGLDDGVDRAALLAEAAVDALHQVDVVARGAARAVLALLALDGDGERRADRLAQLARDAALLAVGIAAQSMQPAEARALGRLLLGVHHGDLAGEEEPAGELQALQQLGEQEARGDAADAHGVLPNQIENQVLAKGSIIMRPTTAIQMSVIGMNTFQPSRMIWS